MRRLFILGAALAALTSCIEEAGPAASNRRSGGDDYNDRDDGCAPAPSGTGAWEDDGSDGIHCNYYTTTGDEWAYTLNWSENDCIKASWAPPQSFGGMVMWVDSTGNRGCDWVIPW